jgi:hypothetical protein
MEPDADGTDDGSGPEDDRTPSQPGEDGIP